jgi:hypothetical protein
MANKTTAAKPAAKKTVAAKKGNAADAIVQALTGAAPKADTSKADAKALAKAAREAERAARYPTAAKQEKERKAAKAVPKAERPAKPVKPVVAFVPKVPAPGKPVHVVRDGPRPTSGARLYAHTKAALHLLGLMDNKAAPMKNVLTVMGQRAVSYHLKENNFVSAPDGKLKLSPAGLSKFRERTVDNDIANAFMTMFVTGKVDSAKLGLTADSVYTVGL